MLAIQVDLLTGRYAASRFDDRDAPEWPPEPGRLFSALVASWADADEPDQAEYEALRWLEQQGAPDISCSAATERSRVTHYVPDNDITVARRDLSATYATVAAAADAARATPDDARARGRAEKSLADARARSTSVFAAGPDSGAKAATALRVLPDQRSRQGRSYPVAIPDDPTIVFTWPTATPDATVAASLGDLLSRVGRLGHSSSFVSCRLVDEAPQPVLTPVSDAEDADAVLRVPANGLLAELEHEFSRHRGREPRVLPSVRQPYALARPGQPAIPAPTNAGTWQVLALVGPAFPATNAVALSRTIRAALAKHSPTQPTPGFITGHVDGPMPSAKRTEGHLSVVPLPFVGREHADGTIKGIALLLPHDARDAETSAVAQALQAWLGDGGRANLGGRLTWTLSTVDVRGSWTQRSDRWRAGQDGALDWRTVTPIALDRTPRHWSRRHRQNDPQVYHEAAEIIAASCLTVGLPRPSEVAVRLDGTMHGVPPVARFRPYCPSPGKPTAISVHAIIRFPQPVHGPILLGRGRHHGAGLLAPLDADK